MSLSLVFLLACGAFAGDGTVAGAPVPSQDILSDLTVLVQKNLSEATRDVDRELQRLSLELTMERSGAPTELSIQQLLKENPAKGAVLFFVLGTPGLKPSWVNDQELAAALSARETERRQRLLDLLRSKSKESCKGKTFLQKAVECSFKVWDQELKKDFLAKLPKGSESSHPSSRAAGARSKIYDPAQGFSWESLYGSLARPGGAVVVNMTAPGETTQRLVSIKIYTTKDPNTNALVDQIGIFDITYPNETYGRRFDLGQSGKQTFSLAPPAPGQKAPAKYTLAMTPDTSGNLQVVVTLEGLNGKTGTAVTTSVNELYQKRTQQALDEGGKININGTDFIVLGQGGAKGSLLFFSSDINERMAKGENVKPELAAPVNERGSDGRNINISGAPALGYVNGKHYRLFFDEKLKYWVVHEAPPDRSGDGGASTSTLKADGSPQGDPKKDVLVTDLSQLGDAMAKGGFDSQAIETAKGNADKALAALKMPTGLPEFQVKGSKESGSLILQPKGGPGFSIWPNYERL